MLLRAPSPFSSFDLWNLPLSSLHYFISFAKRSVVILKPLPTTSSNVTENYFEASLAVKKNIKWLWRPAEWYKTIGKKEEEMRHADAAWVEIISCYGLNLFTNSRSCNFSLTLINSDRCLIFRRSSSGEKWCRICQQPLWAGEARKKSRTLLLDPPRIPLVMKINKMSTKITCLIHHPSRELCVLPFLLLPPTVDINQIRDDDRGKQAASVGKIVIYKLGKPSLCVSSFWKSVSEWKQMEKLILIRNFIEFLPFRMRFVKINMNSKSNI